MVIYSLASDFMPMITQAEGTRIPSPVNLTVMVELVGSLLSMTRSALAAAPFPENQTSFI
jgi:hypothetical protein